MNLLHLISASVPHLGVEHESALGLAGALRARGHRVVLGCITPETDPRLAALHARAVAAGFEEFVPLRFRHRVHPLDDLADVRAIRRAVRVYGIDVVHAHRGKDHTLAILALAGTRVPLVRTKHQLHPFAAHALTRWKNGARTDAVVVPTEGLRRALIDVNRLPADRIHVVPGGVGRVPPERMPPRGAFREKLGIPPDAPLVGLVANLRPEKGVEDFVDAARIVAGKSPDARFAVVGDLGADAATLAPLRARIERAGLAGRFHLAGPTADVWRVYADLDVGAIASHRSDGAGRVLHEMMAAGVPLAATAVGAIPEVLGDGETALVVPPREPGVLAAAIARLLEDPALRARLGEAAQRDERERFGYPVVAAAINNIYTLVIEHPADLREEP